MSITIRRTKRGTSVRASGQDAQALFDAMTAPLQSEEQRLAHDRVLNEAKNNGTYDRVAIDAAMRLDAQHGIGEL
jgi:hypothetical protein